MRCRGCDYELWNMKPGACPECGRQWRFDEFRFRPFAAQFLCPHCEHAYAGSDEQGLPVPRAFICSQCSQPIDLTQMRALPQPNTDGSHAMDDVHPWSERFRLGYWRAFWRSVGQSMSNPTRVGRTLPERTNLRSAMFFSLLCTTVGISIATLPFVFLIGISSSQFYSGLEYALIFLAKFLGIMLGSALFGQIFFVLWGSCAHAILRMSGGVRRPLNSSLSATLFCTGPFLISAVPCCGFYILPVSMIWMAVAMICAFASLHKVSGLRASIAVLTPILALLAGTVLTIAVMIYVSPNTAWSTSGSTSGSTTGSTTGTSTGSANFSPLPPTPADESDSQALPPIGSESPKEE